MDPVTPKTTKTYWLASGANSQYFEPVEPFAGKWFGLAVVPIEDTAEIARLEGKGLVELSDEKIAEARKKKQLTQSPSDLFSPMAPSAPNTLVPPGLTVQLAERAPSESASIVVSTPGDPVEVDAVIAPKPTGRKGKAQS